MLNFVSNLCTDQRKLPKCPIQHYGIAQILYIITCYKYTQSDKYKVHRCKQTLIIIPQLQSGHYITVNTRKYNIYMYAICLKL